MAAAEIGLLEIHMVAFFGKFDDLGEAVHAELVHKGLRIPMAEEAGAVAFPRAPLGCRTCISESPCQVR